MRRENRNSRPTIDELIAQQQPVRKKLGTAYVHARERPEVRLRWQHHRLAIDSLIRRAQGNVDALRAARREAAKLVAQARKLCGQRVAL